MAALRACSLEDSMKKGIVLVLALATAAPLAGCSYGAIATTTDGKVVIVRNDSFLFGALRKVFVCKVTDAGVASCNAADTP